MPNKNEAKNWLIKSYHDLEGAIILFEANHYTDTIGYVLQQSLEKNLKSLLAYKNQKIIKTHNLIQLYESISDILDLNDKEIRYLSIATTYNIKLRYPTPHKKLPQKEEIKELLDFSKKLFEKICKIVEIKTEEIK